MTNIGRLKRARKLVNVTGPALAALIAWTTAAQAADCPRQGTLGTSRILSVDAASAGSAGPTVRARDLLPDREAGVRTPGPGAEDRSRGPHHRPSYLVAS